LGSLKKTEIKKMAAENGFTQLANKRESYEICFIPDNDYRKFLSFIDPQKVENIGDGDFVTTEGKVVGKHAGYPFYTIGQRKGLNVAMGEPYYVVSIDKDENKVVLGKREALLKRTLWMEKWNLMKYNNIQEGMKADVKIRYKDKGSPAKIYPENELVRLVFDEPVSAIAPGQSAVCYENDDIIAGGFIKYAE